jgi:hypothetical protein
MRARFMLAAAIAAASLRAETLDRIAVTVGRQVVTESAILLDLRVSAFLDGTPVDLSLAAKRKSAGRLVDQVLILRESIDSHLEFSVGDEVNSVLEGIKGQYGSESGYQAALTRYGVTEQEVVAQLTAGLRTLRFTDLRFRPDVQISEEDLRAYYDELASGWRQKDPEHVPAFESSRDQVEQLLTGQRLNDALDRWLAMMRIETQIVYRQQVIP